jgi:hypothetical protein
MAVKEKTMSFTDAPWLIIDRMMTDELGETHFVKVQIPTELSPSKSHADIPQIPKSINLQSDRLQIRCLPDGTDINARAPERQFIVVLSGKLEVTVSDGESRSWTAGEILLATDSGKGKGHRTCVTEGMGRFLVIPIGDEVDLDAWMVVDQTAKL